MKVEKSVKVTFEPEEYEALSDLMELARRYIQHELSCYRGRQHPPIIDEYDERRTHKMRELLDTFCINT